MPPPLTGDVVSSCLSPGVPTDEGHQARQLALQDLFKETVCGSDRTLECAGEPLL